MAGPRDVPGERDELCAAPVRLLHGLPGYAIPAIRGKTGKTHDADPLLGTPTLVSDSGSAIPLPEKDPIKNYQISTSHKLSAPAK